MFVGGFIFSNEPRTGMGEANRQKKYARLDIGRTRVCTFFFFLFSHLKISDTSIINLCEI